MGPDTNKLCAIVGGKPLVAGPVDALIEAGIERVFVVTGHRPDEVRAALVDRPCEFVHHAAWEAGMGASIAAGLRGILEHAEPDGVLVCVGDLAGLESAWISALVAAFSESASASCICVPTFEGCSGHPVLFGRSHFEALARLAGEAGGRSILQAHPADILEVAIGSADILRDLDTQADFDAWSARRNRVPS